MKLARATTTAEAAVAATVQEEAEAAAALAAAADVADSSFFATGSLHTRLPVGLFTSSISHLKFRG